MFEILPRDWNLKPNFTQASVDMNWGFTPNRWAIPTLIPSAAVGPATLLYDFLMIKAAVITMSSLLCIAYWILFKFTFKCRLIMSILLLFLSF